MQKPPRSRSGLVLDRALLGKKYVLRLRGFPKYSHLFLLVQMLGLFFFETAQG